MDTHPNQHINTVEEFYAWMSEMAGAPCIIQKDGSPNGTLIWVSEDGQDADECEVPLWSALCRDIIAPESASDFHPVNPSACVPFRILREPYPPA